MTEADTSPKVVGTPTPLTADEKVIESATKALIGQSFDVIRGFARLMISLESGLFAVYYALLKFLGVNSLRTAILSPFELSLTPILFAASILFFVLAALPILEGVQLNNIDDVVKHWNHTLRWKYVFIMIGLALFMVALGAIIWISSSVFE
jgi:hypothetical protein